MFTTFKVCFCLLFDEGWSWFGSLNKFMRRSINILLKNAAIFHWNRFVKSIEGWTPASLARKKFSYAIAAWKSWSIRLWYSFIWRIVIRYALTCWRRWAIKFLSKIEENFIPISCIWLSAKPSSISFASKVTPSASLSSFSLSGGSIESGEPSTSISVSMRTVSSCGLSLKKL